MSIGKSKADATSSLWERSDRIVDAIRDYDLSRDLDPSPQPSPTRGEGAHHRSVAHWRDPSRNYTTPLHNSLALLNENEETRRVFSSRIKVRVIGGSARWLQFSRSQSRQLTPIGVPSAFSRSMPVA